VVELLIKWLKWAEMWLKWAEMWFEQIVDNSLKIVDAMTE